MNVFMQTHGYSISESPLTYILLLFSSHSHFSHFHSKPSTWILVVLLVYKWLNYLKYLKFCKNLVCHFLGYGLGLS